MNTHKLVDIESASDEGSDEIADAIEQLRKEIVGGLLYTHSRANANTSRAQTATFLYALIELRAEKGILTTEELDSRKDKIADRVQKRFLSKGMGVVLQEPERDKHAFQSEAYVDCENRVYLCKAACCRLNFPLSRQDVAERIVKWDLESPYLIAQTDTATAGISIEQIVSALCENIDQFLAGRTTAETTRGSGRISRGE